MLVPLGRITPSSLYGIIFGGIIMAVADQIFAYASNFITYPSIASQFNIHFAAGWRRAASGLASPKWLSQTSLILSEE